jgi:hypothetical protein
MTLNGRIELGGTFFNAGSTFMTRVLVVDAAFVYKHTRRGARFVGKQTERTCARVPLLI